jgi:cysteine desulfurase
MVSRIYLDANAGAPLHPEVRAAMVAALDVAANPSSVHAEGRQARALIEAARAEVAGAVGVRPENVILTSGATEASALALTPKLIAGEGAGRAGHLYVGATEHPCVLAGGRFPPEAVSRLPVHPSGVLDLDALERVLGQHDHSSGAPYVAIMLANNETGVIHPVPEAARIVNAHGGLAFCDAVQALGRIPLDINSLGVDFLALSAHKFGGPQGMGALILADDDLRPEPLMKGGGQEHRRRAGTENVAGAVGFGVAARRAAHHLSHADRLLALRDTLEGKLLAVSPEAKIAGADTERLPNTTMFALPGFSAETMVIAFDLKGVAVSAGSACSSGKVAASHVLSAMGLPADITGSGVRVSLSAVNDDADVEGFIAAWSSIYTRMRQRRAA